MAKVTKTVRRTVSINSNKPVKNKSGNPNRCPVCGKFMSSPNKKRGW